MKLIMVDYSKTTLASPGCKTITHEKPANQLTWSTHCQDGYSLVPAMHHYIYQNIYISSTASERKVDTFEFFPSQFTHAPTILQ
jgi:hypothetical protein